VPLVEAFHMRVPVVAYAATAVPATMDGGGVLFEDRRPAHVAALIDALVGDRALADRVLGAQDAALARLHARDFDSTLLRFVEQAIAAPRHAPPPIAFDFWDQYSAYERLKELQRYRPAVFRALPEGTDE
jgi:hypothetical protein